MPVMNDYEDSRSNQEPSRCMGKADRKHRERDFVMTEMKYIFRNNCSLWLLWFL